MSGDIVLDMPTALRRSISPLELGEAHRLQPPSARTGVTRLTVDVPSSHRGTEKANPSRWRTPEFVFYYVIFVVAVPWMVWVPVSLSSTSHRNYHYCQHRLSPGWLFGRQVDNSDVQYRSFRSNVPALTIFLIIFFAFKFLYTRPIHRASAQVADNLHLLPFYFLFSLIMLAILHGSSAIKVLLILSANYVIALAGKGAKWTVLATWVFNGAVLFANERFGGYRFSSVHPGIAFLDSWAGVYPRWHVSFNITMLRLVSFNMDHYWAHNHTGTLDSGFAFSDKQRTTTYHSPEVYSFRNYLAYVLYPPLYIAGPIMTFNDFMWQLARPLSVSMSGTVRYALRFLGTMLTMEFLLHYMYVVAIKDAHAWLGDSPAELSMIGFWNLIVVWLKLLLPWRFFRLWALLDGVDPPENMVRCMANNYSTLGFWRSWHRSYNLWIVRYIYVPLGGAKRVVLASLLVFTFVALWHDLSFRLLAWGWLITLFILPELAARQALPASKFAGEWWYRHICALGAVVNMFMMVVANLVGFVLGTEGIAYMAQEIVGTFAGMRFLVCACAAMFVGVQVMFEYREEELRHGINRRC